MARFKLMGLAFMGLMLLSLASPQAAAAEDLSVKMWYPDTVRPGRSGNVSLEILSENYLNQINVTWAGIHIDWMTPGDFASNATRFHLRGGQSRIVNLTFQVPYNAKAGAHSNYEVIRYALQNGTGGEWSDATWESVITQDFRVVPESKPSGEWYSWATDNAACICGVLIVVVIVLAVARAARRRLRARAYSEPYRPVMTPSSAPPPGYADRPFPPAPYEATPAASQVEPESEPQPEPAHIAPPPSPPPIPPEPPREPTAVPMSPAPARDSGVDLMTPTDWDKVGASAPAFPPAAKTPSPAPPESGPKFCTYCGVAEPGPVCRNCGRTLV